jgi:site-specific DNA-cytosine methylase
VLDAQYFGVEWPNAAVVCSLSDTLETGAVPQRYYLSAKACAGILRRAEKRGKELPPALCAALMADADKGDQDTLIAVDTAQITSKANRTRAEPGLPSSTISKQSRMHIASGDPVIALQTDVTPKSGDVAFTLKQPSKSGGGQPAAVMAAMQVRRLTPRECERLQGFPRRLHADRHTAASPPPTGRAIAHSATAWRFRSCAGSASASTRSTRCTND